MTRSVLIPDRIAAAAPPEGSRVHAIDGLSMGTTWSLRLAAPEADLAGLRALMQGELDQIVAEMSHWEPGSILSHFNRADPGSWHVLPPRFAQVIDAALALARLSGGAYDPAAGALIDLWGFGAGEAYAKADYQAPSAAQCASWQPAWQALDWQAQGARLRQPGGVRLDLSSIAKGFAVDRMAECLLARGHGHFLVEAGGELRGHGIKPDGEPWWVTLEMPPGLDGEPDLLALHGLAVATSGDYRRQAQGFSHTLDPRLGHPVQHGLASVSVIHTSCMQADALSTAIMVLGPQAGLAFANRLGLAARLIGRSMNGWTTQSSAAWERFTA